MTVRIFVGFAFAGGGGLLLGHALQNIPEQHLNGAMVYTILGLLGVYVAGVIGGSMRSNSQ